MKIYIALFAMVLGVVVLAGISIHDISIRNTVEKTMPPHTLFIQEHVNLDGVGGEAAITPDGRRWFRAKGAIAFQEVKP